MVLTFTTEDNFGNEKTYSWWFSTMEFALDALSSLSLRGRQINKAELIDNADRILLPLAAFDGSTLSEPIRALENQWQQVLNQPLNRIRQVI